MRRSAFQRAKLGEPLTSIPVPLVDLFHPINLLQAFDICEVERLRSQDTTRLGKKLTTSGHILFIA